MTFDCIIPTYNNLEELKRCLNGFALQSFKDFRVLLCVDGSTDGTVEWVRSQTFLFDCRVLEHNDARNHGRNAARNLALEHLRASHVCFFDSDIVPRTDMLAQHAHLLAEKDCVSCGDVFYTNESTNAWAAYAHTRGKNKYQQGETIPYYYLATGNCAHATNYFIQCGGQDPLITGYGGGDTEYAIRLHKTANLPVIFNPNSVGDCVMNKTLDEALTQLQEFGRTNLHYIHRKHPKEERLFGLNIFIGRGLKSHIYRSVMQRSIADFIQRIAAQVPTTLANHLLNYCVLTRIWTGWKLG